jgi:hypothetical protein
LAGNVLGVSHIPNSLASEAFLCPVSIDFLADLTKIFLLFGQIDVNGGSQSHPSGGH